MVQHQDPLQYIKIRIDDRPHIHQIDRDRCTKCQTHPCELFCPSQVFEWGETGLNIQYQRCVECGACLRGCPHANIHWDYPRAGFGIAHEL